MYMLDMSHVSVVGFVIGQVLPVTWHRNGRRWKDCISHFLVFFVASVRLQSTADIRRCWVDIGQLNQQLVAHRLCSHEDFSREERPSFGATSGPSRLVS